jgi:hypothetical protein
VKMAPTSISPAKYLCLLYDIMIGVISTPMVVLTTDRVKEQSTVRRPPLRARPPYLGVSLAPAIFISPPAKSPRGPSRQISATWMIIECLPRSLASIGYWPACIDCIETMLIICLQGSIITVHLHLTFIKLFGIMHTRLRRSIHHIEIRNKYVSNAYIFTRKSCRSRPRRCIPL